MAPLCHSRPLLVLKVQIVMVQASVCGQHQHHSWVSYHASIRARVGQKNWALVFAL